MGGCGRELGREKGERGIVSEREGRGKKKGEGNWVGFSVYPLGSESDSFLTSLRSESTIWLLKPFPRLES